MLSVMLFGSPIIDVVEEGEIVEVEIEETPHAYPPYINEEKGREAYIETLEKTIEGLKEELADKEEEINKLNEKLKSVNNNKNVSRETISKKSAPTMTFEATYYGMDCNGCSGITASGLNTNGGTTYNGMKIIAVDRNVIPLHSIVEISHNGKSYKAVAKDTGGAIKGNRIDILVGSEAESYNYGRHNVELKIIERGSNKYIRE